MPRLTCLLAAACCGLAVAASLPMQAYLQPETLRGCVVADGAVRLPEPLPTQQGAEPVCIEAESFATVQWQNDQGRAIADDAAAGGQGVAFAQELIYHFTIAREGMYTYWQRAWMPQLASWVHGVQVDDATPFDLAFGTRPQDKPQEWFWIAGPQHYLKPGVHTLAVRNLHNGKRLDRFVLLLDDKWQPADQGPAATPIRETNEGEYLSRPLGPIAWQRWSRLTARAAGDATVTVAGGDGTFAALPPEGKLSGLATPLRVRVTLRRLPGEPSPTVRLGAVEYQAAAEAFIVLRNQAVELLLERRTGRLCGLRDARTGRRYLPDGAPGALFTLDTKAYDAPETTPLSSDDARVVASHADGKTATFTFALAQDKLRVTTTFALQADWTVRAVLAVDNRTDRDVVAAHFPRLAGAQCGEDGTDDWLCFPDMSGLLVPRPGRAGTLTNPHPMRATTGFCDLYDAQGGLTLAPTDWPMVFSEFTSEPDPGGESVNLRLARRDRVPAGSKATFTAAFGVHPGDWHTAADWYRQWFARHVGRVTIPAWVYDSDGWVTSDTPEDMAGLGFTHIQMWRETGYGACPTYYYPNPAYRSEQGFRDLARQWRALGGHLGVYFHGNSLSRGYVQADKVYGLPIADIPEAKRPPSWDWYVRNAAYGPDRKPPDKLDMSSIPEPAEFEEYPGMTWHGSQWPGFLRKWALDIYLRDYGLDTPYWDTLACWDGQEYNPYLKQNGEGRDSMARYQFLREMRDAGRKLAPGFHQTVEGGSELLGLVAGQLESNFVRNLEVARYTHPDQVYHIGHSNGWWDPPKTELSAAMAFWLNTKLDLIRLTPGVMDIVRARRWFAPWLNRARFLDNLGLDLTSDRIKGALHLHQGPKGKALLATFMNWQKIPGQRATVDVGRYLGKSPVRAYVVSLGAEPSSLKPLATKSGVWTVEMPTAQVCAMLLLQWPQPVTPVAQAWQENEQVRLRVFDPAAKPRQLALTFSSAEARLAVSTAITGEGAAVFGADLPYANFDALTTRLHADLTLRDGATVVKARSLVAPRFADPDFERDTFDSAQAHTGRRSLRLDPGGLTHFPLELVPGRKYRLSLWILRQEQVGSVMANVHLHLTNQSHHFGWEGKSGEWTRVETVYEMKGPEQPHLYLYDWQGTTKPAWFDAVKVEDITGQQP